MDFVAYDNEQLVPGAWRSGHTDRTFNPTLTAVEGGFAMCYRVVEDDTGLRRFATCQLDQDLVLVPGSITPLSDEVSYVDATLNDRARTWHADPRYVRLGDRLFLIWNDGANRPANHQFLAPMSADGLHFAGPAVEITTGIRRPTEKNWAPFEVDGKLYATYNTRPHLVLGFDLEQRPRIEAGPAFQSGFSTRYEDSHGLLRGGAQPVRDGETFLVLGHSSVHNEGARKYRAAFTRFSAEPPFEVVEVSEQPYELPNPFGTEFLFEKLNEVVGDVIYPCGMVDDGESWVISYGINDERAAVARVSKKSVADSLQPVRFAWRLAESSAFKRPDKAAQALARTPAVKPAALPLWWYNAQGRLFDGPETERRFQTGNFGDIASRDVVEKVSGLTTTHMVTGRPRLLAIGSVLHRAQSGDVVWGSGVKGEKEPFAPGTELDVYAVRGPLTLEWLKRGGVDVSKVSQLFDPGVLVPHLWADEIAGMEHRGGDRIIPHYRDDLEMRQRHADRLDQFVSVDTSPLEMVRSIIGADRVFSSSLHGVIFAEALGIPAYWLAPLGDEDEMKYHDYYLGTERSNVLRFESLEDALKSDPMPLPTFDPAAYLETFPHEAAARLTYSGLLPGDRVDLMRFDSNHLDSLMALSGFGVRDHRGLWMTGTHAAISSRVHAEPGTTLSVGLVLRPFNPQSMRGGQVLRVRLNDGPVVEVDWHNNTRDGVELRFELPVEQAETPLDFTIEAHHRRSPRLVRSADIWRRVAAVVMAVRVSSADHPAKPPTARGA